ncbi:hypothetical protein E05_37830 [Plautia stali symbiont]|nr:hypothetical protein E05_37830 [Plautia stali symbiont]
MTIDNDFVWRGETEKEFQALSEVLQLKSLLQKHVEALGFDAFAFFGSASGAFYPTAYFSL